MELFCSFCPSIPKKRKSTPQKSGDIYLSTTNTLALLEMKQLEEMIPIYNTYNSKPYAGYGKLYEKVWLLFG